MANDADLRSLTRAVKGVEDQLKDMTKVLKVLNDNFAILIRDFREARSEEQDGS